MKKFKFLGLFLALSLIFSNTTSAQIGTKLIRLAGGSSGNAWVSLCSTFVCIQHKYPGPGSHTFAMTPADVFEIVIEYGTGYFWVYRFAVDAEFPNYYNQNNGTNTLLIRKTGTGTYEFIII